MAFQDYSFPQVIHDFGLNLADADLFAQIPPAPVRPDFLALVMEGANLASAINNEKARSEFVIARVLLELRRRHLGHFGLFSGVELDADASRGLCGECGFIITKSPLQHVLTAPVITIIEVANQHPRQALDRCIAAMCAAQLFNQAASAPIPAIYGAVTTGTEWKYLDSKALHWFSIMRNIRSRVLEKYSAFSGISLRRADGLRYLAAIVGFTKKWPRRKSTCEVFYP